MNVWQTQKSLWYISISHFDCLRYWYSLTVTLLNHQTCNELILGGHNYMSYYIITETRYFLLLRLDVFSGKRWFRYFFFCDKLFYFERSDNTMHILQYWICLYPTPSIPLRPEPTPHLWSWSVTIMLSITTLTVLLVLIVHELKTESPPPSSSAFSQVDRFRYFYGSMWKYSWHIV